MRDQIVVEHVDHQFADAPRAGPGLRAKIILVQSFDRAAQDRAAALESVDARSIRA